MSSDLKANSRLFFESMSRGDLNTIENELLSPDVQVHFPGQAGTIPVKAFRQMGAVYLAAFPDCKMTVLNQYQEGDTVVTLALFEGTQKGQLLTIPPTGRKVRQQSVTIDRYKDGKVIERWDIFDQLDMMVQLGMIPAPTQA